MSTYLLRLSPDIGPSLTVRDDSAGVIDPMWSVVGEAIGDPTWTHEWGGNRGSRGSRPSASDVGNRDVSFSLKCSAPSKAELAVEQGKLDDTLEDLRRYGGIVEWRPHGLARVHRFRVKVGAVTVGEWGHEFETLHTLRPVITFTCEPYIWGPAYDYDDDFATVPGAPSWTYLTGAEDRLSAADGLLRQLPAYVNEEHRILLTGESWPVIDKEVSVVFTPAALVAGMKAGVIVHSAPGSVVEVYVTDNGTVSRCGIAVNGVVTGEVDLIPDRMVVGEPYLIRGRVAGGYIAAEVFPRSPVGATKAPTSSLARYPSVDAVTPGRSGIIMRGGHASASLQRFRHRPFTYRNIIRREPIMPTDVIAGEAPALADATMSFDSSAAAGALPWGLLAWSPEPEPRSMIRDGNYEGDDHELIWAAVTGVTTAAVPAKPSLTSTTSRAGRKAVLIRFGAGSGQGVTHVVRGSGVYGWARRRLRARAWVRLAGTVGFSPATSVRLKIGTAGGSFSGSTVTLTNVWQRVSVDIIGVDGPPFYVALEKVDSAGASTDVLLDDLAIWTAETDDTREPPSRSRRYGAPPWGYVSAIAEHERQVRDGTMSTVADSVSPVGARLRLASSVPAGGATYSMYLHVSADAVPPEDFGGAEREVELWMRMGVHPAFTGGVRVFAPTLDALAGVAVPRPTSGGLLMRLVRVGSVTLAPPDTPGGAQVIQVNIVVGAGTNAQPMEVDGFWLVPARSRATFPTGKANGASYGGLWPAELDAGVDQERVIRSDLAGELVSAVEATAAPSAYGSAIELPVGGRWQVMVMASQQVPGDPTNVSVGDTYKPDIDLHLAVTPRFTHLIPDD